MKKKYYLIIGVIIATTPSFHLLPGNKHPGPKHPEQAQSATTPQPPAPRATQPHPHPRSLAEAAQEIDSDDDDYIPQPRQRTRPRRRNIDSNDDSPATRPLAQRHPAPILTQERHDERIEALQAQVAALKNTVSNLMQQALKRGEKIEALVPKAEHLKETAQKLESQAQEAKKQAQLGFSGPLNDVFNGASFALTSIFYGTLLYDEYMSLQNDEVKNATGFARFTLHRFCKFKWSLTDAARIAWIAIIAKIIFDYYG